MGSGNMVSMNDYVNFGDGFGVASALDVAELNKALTSGAYAQASGVAGQVNGAALQVESLENSLKVLTYSDEHVKFWKKIAKVPAYSTVEEYNQLISYGSDNTGFVPEGILPEEEDSEYRRQASFVKFLGTTRSVTHPMTLVRSAHGDVIALENQNGILWIMKKAEDALFWGNSKLAPAGQEGFQFDGLDQLIHKDNVIDLKGRELRPEDINDAAQMILDNYGVASDLYMPYDVLSVFSQEYFPKERIIMPTTSGGYQAGVVVNKFQTQGGEVAFQPDIFLRKTVPMPTSAIGKEPPTAPGNLAAAVDTGQTGDFGKTGAGTYTYYVTAASRKGESTPCTVKVDVALTSGDLDKAIKLTISNSASMISPPDYFKVYRTEVNGDKAYHIMDVPAASVAAGGQTIVYDVNYRIPNTYTAFMGEFTEDVICFKQLAPMMKMDLAIVAPRYSWMILLYGVPQLYAPKKWMRFVNIKAKL